MRYRNCTYKAWTLFNSLMNSLYTKHFFFVARFCFHAVPDTCPDDYYGVSCAEKCHCKNAAKCDKMSGACSNGACEPGYKVYDNDHCEGTIPDL